jgi:Fe2+ or Zn2+ uptake regulation protein
MTNQRDNPGVRFSPAEWQTRLQQTLAAAGFHSTLPRRLMVTWIAETDGPFSAEALVSELEQRRGGTRATVYRFVDWLRDHGWIERVYSDTTRHTYIRRQPGHRHQAICTRCGATVAIDSCAVEEFVAPQLASAGFAIHGHVLDFSATAAPAVPWRSSDDIAD